MISINPEANNTYMAIILTKMVDDKIYFEQCSEIPPTQIPSYHWRENENSLRETEKLN